MSPSPATPDIPAALLKALVEGRCLLFVGAGVSQGEGLPSAGELADILSEKVRKYDTDESRARELERRKGNLAEIATIYQSVFSREDARTAVCSAIREKQVGVAPEFHGLLSRLTPVEHVVTTNWDTLLEDSCPPEGTVVIRRDQEIRSVRPRWTNIYKLHGCITDPTKIILDLDDYSRFESERKALTEELRSLIRKNILLCIGYGLQDSNFRTIVRAALGEHDSVEHYFVTPGEASFQKDEWSSSGFVHIKATGTHFVRTLLDRWGSHEFAPDTAHIVLERSEPADQVRESFNPFELYDTDLLARSDPEHFVRYFIPPVGFAKIQGGSNTVIEGHRGSGKSMVLRYLSIFHDDRREEQLPFFGFYIKLDTGFFDVVTRTEEHIEDWVKRFQHYFNLVVATGILENVATAVTNGTLNLVESEERECVRRIRSRLLKLEPGDFGDDLSELKEQMFFELDQLRDKPDHDCHRTGANFLQRVLEHLVRAVGQLDKKRWVLLLDEWDNLSQPQQAAVVKRLHDRSPELRYKVAAKTLGFSDRAYDGTRVDITDDFSYVPVDHHLFDRDEKSAYFTFLRAVGDKRLEISGCNIRKLEELFPRSSKQPTKGYDYSGFEQFAMLSSGLVREFLELCKDALYVFKPQLARQRMELEPVPVKWQNHVAKLHASIHFNHHRGCQDSELVEKLLFTLGSVFRAIDKATSDQKEHRRPLSFEITDALNLDTRARDVLMQAVAERLLQWPDIPVQPRNVAEGPKQKYVIHRLMCPLYGLSLHERYSVPIASAVFEQIWLDPHAAMKELTKGFRKKQVDRFLPEGGTASSLFDPDLR